MTDKMHPQSTSNRKPTDNGAGADGRQTHQPAPTIDARRTDAAARNKPTVSHMLGEITWLLTQSPTHKHFALADLEWLVMPPLLLEQYRVFHGETTPVGVALWASLSAEAEAKLNAGVGRLRPDEWKSGDRLWLVDLITPFATPDNKMVEQMLADLMKTALKGQRFKFHKTDPATGKRDTVEIGG